MSRRFSIFAFPTVAVAAVAVALALCGAASAGTVNGTITYDGKVPALKPLSMDADPTCAQKHQGPVPNEMLVLGSGNALANVLVRVTSGLPADKQFPAPKEPVVMDQNGCIYKPHVFALVAGQPLKILNSDGVLHNVHALPSKNPQFNQAMPPTRKEAETVFTKPEDPFKIKCDVHPWMTAYAAVLTNPFYAVTKEDGKFSIPNLPAGTYEIEAWHEKLGPKKEKVTVGADDTKTVDFKFAPPAGPQ